MQASPPHRPFQHQVLDALLFSSYGPTHQHAIVHAVSTRGLLTLNAYVLSAMLTPSSREISRSCIIGSHHCESDPLIVPGASVYVSKALQV